MRLINVQDLNTSKTLAYDRVLLFFTWLLLRLIKNHFYIFDCFFIKRGDRYNDKTAKGYGKEIGDYEEKSVNKIFYDKNGR